MRFMNEYDLQDAARRFNTGNTPNRLRIANTVQNLADWADRNSDGWAHWPKPGKAADKAMQLIESRTWAENNAQEREDATTVEVTAALRPIKAFLTRNGVPHGEVIA